MKTQEYAILEHLKYKGAITPLEALNLYGCLRLASVIHELKKEGKQITTTTVHNGRKHFASYTLGAPKAKVVINETLEKMKQWEKERENGT